MSKHKDRFASLSALMSELAENKDYLIRTRNRKSPVTIISPHGGFIEAGTSHIAEAVAGRNFNLFDFQGLQAVEPLAMHITSTRFRHPALAELLANSTLAVSIHGMGTVDSWNVWLGGLNLPLKNGVEKALVASGFSVITDAPRYRGESTANVVNLPRDRGVQLELPRDLVEAMFEDKVAFSAPGIKPKTTLLFRRFIKAVRQAIFQEVRRAGRLAS